MSFGPVYVSPVARAVPFDNATNGFVSTEVQSAIEEAQKTVLSVFAQSSSTVSTTSATYGTIADMTLTPVAGKWMHHFTCNFRSTGVNTMGNIAFFKNGVQVASTTRQTYDNAAILGLVTLSTNEGACSAAIVYQDTWNGTDVLTVRFNETQGGTTYVDGRTIFGFQVGL